MGTILRDSISPELKTFYSRRLLARLNGDGITDQTKEIQEMINQAVEQAIDVHREYNEAVYKWQRYFNGTQTL